MYVLNAHGYIHSLDWTTGYWTTGLDYWTGLLDWITGLDYWTGLLDWITGLDYWTGLLYWTQFFFVFLPFIARVSHRSVLEITPFITRHKTCTLFTKKLH